MYYDSPAYDLATALSIAVERNSIQLGPHAKDIELSPAHKALTEKREHWRIRLPDDPEKLWDWLMERDQSEVMDLLALCVAQTVYAVRLPHQSSLSRFAAAANLGNAVSLDMADWWKPTGEAYLSRVKKNQIIEALTEATGAKDIEDLKAMKKSDLVVEAEKRLANTRWLPRILRC